MSNYLYCVGLLLNWSIRTDITKLMSAFFDNFVTDAQEVADILCLGNENGRSQLCSEHVEFYFHSSIHPQFYMVWCLNKQTSETLINVNLRVVSDWLHKQRHVGPRQIIQGRDKNLEITAKCLSVNIFVF